MMKDVCDLPRFAAIRAFLRLICTTCAVSGFFKAVVATAIVSSSDSLVAALLSSEWRDLCLSSACPKGGTFLLG